ncbi:hypothetical protein KR084_012801 [Drosophila pseudotakahashii]|nr:hypothetical protein KR084_012801 [Drosophila pseudotakahashii]
MSLFRWRDSHLLHTLNFVRGIRSGAKKVANNPRQRNRLRRQAEYRSCSRPRREQPAHQKLENQELTSYGQYMEKMIRLYEQQMKMEEDIAREEKRLKMLQKEKEELEEKELANKTPLILCAEDVTGLRKLYLMDSEEHQNNVLMMYDDTRSFMDEHIEEAEDVGPNRFLLSEDNVPQTPDSENEKIVDLPEMEDDDGIEQWDLDSSHGNWVRRVMEFLRFRRLS